MILESGDNETVLKNLGIVKMLLCRVCCFTDLQNVALDHLAFRESFARDHSWFGGLKKDDLVVGFFVWPCGRRGQSGSSSLFHPS